MQGTREQAQAAQGVQEEEGAGGCWEAGGGRRLRRGAGRGRDGHGRRGRRGAGRGRDGHGRRGRRRAGAAGGSGGQEAGGAAKQGKAHRRRRPGAGVPRRPLPRPHGAPRAAGQCGVLAVVRLRHGQPGARPRALLLARGGGASGRAHRAAHPMAKRRARVLVGRVRCVGGGWPLPDQAGREGAVPEPQFLEQGGQFAVLGVAGRRGVLVL